MDKLSLFYAEPDDDRWVPFDRYPRRIVRRLVRGASRPGGQMRVFLNLCSGLDRLSISYRVNDYRYVQRNPDELACIVGKPCVLNRVVWRNPILFGASIYSHPLDDPQLLNRLPIKKVLVPGPWMKEMCKPHWGSVVDDWPVGIDTELWQPSMHKKSVDVLVYDKLRWQRDSYESALLKPILDALRRRHLACEVIRYGTYVEEEFHSALDRCRAMIFLCEHETQGIAYQQALSCGIPIFAWDRGGFWQDPSYFPDKVKFAPVTSVPYWDDCCGAKFRNLDEFNAKWNAFWSDVEAQRFRPRDYILENLTLEKCARRYVEFANEIVHSIQ